VIKLPSPKLPSYDVDAWRRLPFPERLRLVCQSWAVDGYGTPGLVLVAYVLKIGLYVGGWLAFCALSAGLGGPASIATWWFEPEALVKAVLWSMAFEVLGLGCGSGPLTGRYLPPIGGVLYFARPGTLKRPLVPSLPLLGGTQRTWLDVALYVAHLALLFRALAAESVGLSQLLPIALVFPLLSVADTTLFLASRAEHYFTALVCFLFAADMLPATKLVWVGIWMWAATSKLNRHFPAVVCVMLSNSAVVRWPWFRERMYARYPDDLRPSRLAHGMAHAGTLTELVFPIVLLTSEGGLPTAIALGVMLAFHLFITSHVPMGVPIEWNVIMVYGAFVLFGHHAEVRAWEISSVPLALFLAGALFVVPLVGNFFPRLVSFLPSMRYYAGNWAYSVWLFRGESVRKLETLVTSAPLVHDQLRRLYDERTTVATISKVMAFRAMHLHGRALRELVPKAVDDVDAFEWLDGELVAGYALGWNFGDGHLHDERLLAAIQERCGFEEGELRCIFVESQPMLRPRLPWRIVDAKTGELERGHVDVDSLLEGQPWPERASAADERAVSSEVSTASAAGELVR
jgi:hypothetical protein